MPIAVTIETALSSEKSTVTFAWPAHVAPDLAAVQHALDEAVHMAENPLTTNPLTTNH